MSNSLYYSVESIHVITEATQLHHNPFARLRAYNLVNETTSKRAKNSKNGQLKGKSGSWNVRLAVSCSALERVAGKNDTYLTNKYGQTASKTLVLVRMPMPYKLPITLMVQHATTGEMDS